LRSTYVCAHEHIPVDDFSKIRLIGNVGKIQARLLLQDEPLEELLFSDSCFMTAGKALAAQLTQPQSQPQLPAVPAFLTKQTSIRP
jgi:hypothetical protein